MEIEVLNREHHVSYESGEAQVMANVNIRTLHEGMPIVVVEVNGQPLTEDQYAITYSPEAAVISIRNYPVTDAEQELTFTVGTGEATQQPEV
jgi:hypothetical protein